MKPQRRPDQIAALRNLLTAGKWPTGLPILDYERRVIAANIERLSR